MKSCRLGLLVSSLFYFFVFYLIFCFIYYIPNNLRIFAPSIRPLLRGCKITKILSYLMNIREKLFHRVLLACVLIFASKGVAYAQLDLTLDTIECHIIGFNVGMKIPSTQFSFGLAPDGSTSRNATMASLYEGPYIEYGINWQYKYASNWLLSFDANMWIGNDNLQHREDRMGSVYTRDNLAVIGTGGTDAGVACGNRALSLQGGIGRIFTVAPERNPNSGILGRISAGYMRQQTIFMQSLEAAPQVNGDYGCLYDHQRHGLMLTEDLGYWFMSNHFNLVNFYATFEVSQIWSWSTRDYTIDYYLGMQGKDNNRYFDLMYSIKFCWMFPLRGKLAHDYYYY